MNMASGTQPGTKTGTQPGMDMRTRTQLHTKTTTGSETEPETKSRTGAFCSTAILTITYKYAPFQQEGRKTSKEADERR